MPEYLAPGVYVEEVSFRQKTIEGVSTSTTGFIGPARFGPLHGEPELLTSFSDFERIYGGIDQLEFEDQGLPFDNHLAQGVRAFFEEGGRRLYVERTFAFPGEVAVDDQPTYGRSRWPAVGASPQPFELVARFPGRAGDFTVTMVFRLGENILHTEPVDPADSSSGAPTHNILRGAQNLDTVWAEGPGSPPGSPAGDGRLYWVDRYFDEAVSRWTFRLRDDDPANDDPPVGEVELDAVGSVRVLTVGVVLSPLGRFGEEQAWEGLTFHPDPQKAKALALSRVYDPDPANPSAYLRVPLTFGRGSLNNGAAVAEALLQQPNVLDGTLIIDNLTNAAASDAARTFRVRLEGGRDGDRPGPGEYQGDEQNGLKSGLLAFEDVEDISIVAAPGSTFGLENGYRPRRGPSPVCSSPTASACATGSRCSTRARARRSPTCAPSAARSTPRRAALYYPWVRVFDPFDRARDRTCRPRASSPASTPATTSTAACTRRRPTRSSASPSASRCCSTRRSRTCSTPRASTACASSRGAASASGARAPRAPTRSGSTSTCAATSPSSSARSTSGTQWAVFEPNGERAVGQRAARPSRTSCSTSCQSGHLLGSKPEEAFFVRCDRTTMTQNDLDNGRLVCLIGVAPLRPAEFVIFRIGQKTADSRT